MRAYSITYKFSNAPLERTILIDAKNRDSALRKLNRKYGKDPDSKSIKILKTEIVAYF